jgi:hypothetical protein
VYDRSICQMLSVFPSGSYASAHCWSIRLQQPRLCCFPRNHEIGQVSASSRNRDVSQRLAVAKNFSWDSSQDVCTIWCQNFKGTLRKCFPSGTAIVLLELLWPCLCLSLSLWKKKKNLQVLPSSIIMTCKWFYSSYINLMKLNVYILPEAKQNLWSGSWKRNVDPSRAPIATNSVSMSFTALQQTSKLYRRQPWGHRMSQTDTFHWIQRSRLLWILMMHPDCGKAKSIPKDSKSTCTQISSFTLLDHSGKHVACAWSDSTQLSLSYLHPGNSCRSSQQPSHMPLERQKYNTRNVDWKIQDWKIRKCKRILYICTPCGFISVWPLWNAHQTSEMLPPFASLSWDTSEPARSNSGNSSSKQLPLSPHPR